MLIQTKKQAYVSPLAVSVPLETEPCMQNASTESGLSDLGSNELIDELDD